MSNLVKYFHSGMPGAPVVLPVADSIIGVLDACLVNGFGVKTVDSLVVNDSVATITVSTGHAAEADTVILITGATPVELNGEKKVLSATTTSITFDATGISNQAATGTITFKMAPLGWGKPFSATNVAVYRSANVLSPRNYLRVDDSNQRWAAGTAYASMTAASTGDNQYPTTVQVNGGALYLRKRGGTVTGQHGTTPSKWFVIGDDRMFYIGLVINPITYDWGYCLGCFGDLISYRPGDAYGVVNAFGNDNQTTSDDSSYYYWGANVMLDDNSRMYCARTQNAIGGSTPGYFAPRGYITGNGSSQFMPNNTSNSLQRTFPNPSDQAIYFNRVEYLEGGGIRGLMPGWYITPHGINQALTGSALATQFGKLDATVDTQYRKLIWFQMMLLPGAPYSAPMFFDLTGPWR